MSFESTRPFDRTKDVHPIRVEKIAIALAAFRPDLELLRIQLKTIQAQTFENWTCVVSFDSPLETFLQSSVFTEFKGDSRFHWIQNPKPSGAKNNFEFAAKTALGLGPHALAFSDQDDLWYPEKLQILRERLRETGALSLVHCDMHLLYGKGLDTSSVDRSSTAWQVERRGVQNSSLEHFLVRNCVAGAGLLMDAELWRHYPEIPAAIPFHDHWAAIIASAHGVVVPCPDPLYAYRLHEDNVLGITPYRGRFSTEGSGGKTSILRAAQRRWKTSAGLAQAVQRSKLPLTPLQEKTFLDPKDRGFRFLWMGIQHFYGDPALSRACFARALGKFSSTLGKTSLPGPDLHPILPERCNAGAVIVTYHPDLGLQHRLAKLLTQVSQVVIVDNGSSEGRKVGLKDLESKNVSVILNEKNLGIASGFNIGVQRLLENEDVRWVAFFDQDSEVLDHYLSSIQNCFRDFQFNKRLAVIGCNYVDLNTGKTSEPTQDLSFHPPYFLKKTVISSGSWVPVAAWKMLGPLRDEFFIDHVDDEYCLRARMRGYEVIQTVEPVLNHRIGSSVMRKFLWRTAYPMNQPAFRWYYVARNFTILAREYFLLEFRWVAHAFFAIFKRFVKMVIYEDHRPEKIRSVFRGIWAGLRPIWSKG